MDDELREKIIDILYGEDVWVPQARWEKVIMPLISELEKLRAAEQTLAPDVLERCAKCNALIETTVHCDNCGTFEPTRS